jgi:hypothetical protein
MPGRSTFGSTRQLVSKRWQASYWHEGVRYVAPNTFSTKADANAYLGEAQTEIGRGEWIDPRDGKVLLLTTRETDQLKNADEGDEEEEGECHAPSLSTESCIRKSRSTVRITLSAPTPTVLEARLEDVLRPPSDVSRHQRRW